MGLAVRPGSKKNRVTLLSRRSLNWTAQFPAVAAAAAALPVADALLDGELVIQLPDGRDDFNALQNAAGAQDPQRSDVDPRSVRLELAAR
jgi:bifunctional non-homologous end joining protein LigD